MPRCVAIGCNKNGNHSFPKDLRRRKQWEVATKIRNFKSSANSRLCSDHFKDSDFQDLSTSTGLPQLHKFLKKTAVPSVFSWNKQTSPATSARTQRYLIRSTRQELFPCTSQQVSQQEPFEGSFQDLSEENINLPPDFQEEIIVTTNDHHNIETGNQNNTTSTQTPFMHRLFSRDDLLSDNKSVLFYTGLEDIRKFQLVLSTLLPMANHLNYKGSQVHNVTVEDQFLIMLIKIRRNKQDFELSKMFGVSTTEVGNIFITWVNFVYELWSLIDIWPSRALVDYYMPALFKQYHPSTRIIIDGTEILITKPKNPISQQATFSSYKHHNTVKFLVGATPGGLISFCSEGYAGSTSDRQITERTSLLTQCDKKDAIMADRGFNVQDLFEDKDVTVITPTFLKGLTQLPGVKLKHDRQLAKNRIHIERLIGLTKTFKILKSEINAYYVPLLSRIFYICIMLCNFKEGIVK